MPRWKHARHLDYLSSIVTRCVLDPDAPKRVAISIPPRHGKSEMMSLGLPLWFLELFPTKRVVLTSYEANFAGMWGGKARDIAETNRDSLRIRVRQDISARHTWQLTDVCADGSPGGGGMITAGAGGPITGKGGELFVIDDPHKNWEEANSRTFQEKIYDWYTGTLRDRMDSEETPLFLVMQRWAKNDLVGRIEQAMKDGGEEWLFIELPAFAEEGDSLGRQAGEALWPEKRSPKMLSDLKRALGPHKFNAKFQQRPENPEGQLIKASYFRYFAEENGFYELSGPETGAVKRVPRDKCWGFQTVDTAATENQRSDYFVIEDWLVTPDSDLLLSDVTRERAETTRHMPLMERARTRFKPRQQVVENKTFGLAIIQEGKRRGLPIRGIEAKGDKYSRALPLEARYAAGSVYHKRGARYLPVYEDEVLAFPGGDHDDQVDAAAYAAIWLGDHLGHQPSVHVLGEKKPEDKETDEVTRALNAVKAGGMVAVSPLTYPEIRAGLERYADKCVAEGDEVQETFARQEMRRLDQLYGGLQ